MNTFYIFSILCLAFLAVNLRPKKIPETMIVRNFRKFSFPGQLAIFLMLLGGGIMLASFASAGTWIMMTGKSLLTLQNDMANPAYYYAVIVLQAINTFFLFFLPAWIFAKICYQSPQKFMGIKTPFNFPQVVWMLAILALTFPLSDTLSQLTRAIPLPGDWKAKFDAMETARAAQEAILIKIDSLPKYLISLALIGVLPAIFEEVLFRGTIQNFLTRWFKGPWAAILLTAFIFSIIHLSFYGFFVRFALGIILGLIFYYSGSLWLAILLHFLFNALQVTALYIVNTGQKPSVKDVEANLPIWIGAVALVILVYAFKKFKDISWKNQEIFEYKDTYDPDNFQDWIAKNS